MNTHKKFVFYGKNAKEWMRKCELLLPEIERKKIWKKKRYGSIYEYAAKLAGMSRRKVDDCLWVLRKIEDKPKLKEVAEKKGINRIRPVVTSATKETDEFFAKKAEEMSQNALRAFMKKSRVNPKPKPAKSTIFIKLDTKLANKLEALKEREDFEKLLEKFVDSLEEMPEPVQAGSRHVPKKTENYVVNKTAGRCAHCNRKYDVLHHIDRFAQHPTHDPDKIIPLCNGCHELAHLGYIENEHDPPTEWRVRKHPKPSSIDLKWKEHTQSP